MGRTRITGRPAPGTFIYIPEGSIVRMEPGFVVDSVEEVWGTVAEVEPNGVHWIETATFGFLCCTQIDLDDVRLEVVA